LIESSEISNSRSAFPILVILLIVVYAVVFSVAGYCQYRSFSYQDMDLAAINQAFWNGIHGRFITASHVGESALLNTHKWFISVFLLPLYALFPGPLILLYIQAIAISIGAWAVYLLARKALNPALGLLFSFCYLIYPSLNYITLYEFHPIVFAIPLLLFTFYFYQSRKWTGYLIFLVLALSCREDVVLPVFGMGIYFLLRAIKERGNNPFARWRWGVSAVLLSVFWFVICNRLIPGLAAQLNPEADQTNLIPIFFGWLGDTPVEMAETMMTRPGYILSGVLTGPKLMYLFQLLLPLGFLSLLSPASCIMIIVPALEGLLSSRSQHFSIQYQYTALIIPFVFISAIRGTRNLLRWKWLKFKPDYLVIFLLLVSPFSARMLGPLFRLPGKFRQWRVTKEDAVRKEMVRMIPDQAPVLATFGFASHLSNRPQLFYSFQICGGWRPGYRVDLPLVQRSAKFALIDFNDPLTFYYFYGPDGDRYLREFLEDGWQLEETINSLALFRKGDSNELGLIGKVDPSRISIPLNQPIIDLPGLKLRGYNIRHNLRLGRRMVETVVFLECDKKVNRDYLLTARFRQHGGQEFAFGQSFFAPYRILPTSEWKPGEVVRQKCVIMIPREAPAGTYDMILSLLESAGQGEFECEVIYTKDKALTIRVLH